MSSHNKNTTTATEDRPEPMEVDEEHEENNRKEHHVAPRILLKEAKEMENLLATLDDSDLVQVLGESAANKARRKINKKVRNLREKAAEGRERINSEKTAAWNRAEEATNDHLSVDGEHLRKLMKRKVTNDTEGGKPVERWARITEETTDKINGFIDVLENLKDELEDEQADREEAEEEKKRRRKENARKASKKRKAKASVAKSNSESASDDGDDEDDEEHFSLKRTRVVEAGAE